MSCYELLGIKEEKLELGSLTNGVDFVCIDTDGMRSDDKFIIFLTASIALKKIKSLNLGEKAKIKRFPYDIQMIPAREEYVGEEITLQELEREARSR